MSKKPPRDLYSYAADAPDLLLKKISDLSATLLNAQENPTKNQKAIEFYSGILATMKYAWAYMIQLKFITDRNAILEAENKFLKEYAGSLKERLTNYEVIESLKISGNFEKTVEAVNQYLKAMDDLTTTNE